MLAYQDAIAEVNALSAAIVDAVTAANTAHNAGDRVGAWRAWRKTDAPLRALDSVWIGDTERSRAARSAALTFYRATGGSSSYLNAESVPTL